MINETAQKIRADYAAAAAGGTCLCATSAYDGMDLGFIPEEVRAHNQGCSSPLSDAWDILKEGGTLVDLGCGAGLDVFLAARIVGPEGRAIGIDMTPEMLEIAERAAPEVARALGCGNTVFQYAQIECLPLEDRSADVVISNCVINLSTEKAAIFSEIFRVLKPGGSFIISDVFAAQPVPHYIQNDSALISRCIGGAQEYKEFARVASEAGFRCVYTVRGGSYTRIDGLDFLSLTVTGLKPPVSAGGEECTAVLTGPPSRVRTEFGTAFERGEPVKVGGDVADLLLTSAYSDYFRVAEDPSDLRPDHFTRIVPVPGPCRYKGKFAMLTGPFTEIEDDDGHVYKLGEPLEICEKTASVLDFPMYKKLFVFVSRAAGREVSANDTVCGDNCC